MGTTNEPRRVISTANTVFEIIEFITTADGPGVSEVADEVGMARSTVHDYLKTLEYSDHLIENEGGYYLGLKFLNYGLQARANHLLSEVEGTMLSELAEETGCSVWVYVEEHGKAVVIDTVEAPNGSVTQDWRGKRLPIHCPSGGKAILAYLPEDRITEIVAQEGLRDVTDNTITDYDELEECLERIRQRGYAVNQGETIEGIKGIGSPVLIDGHPIGSIAVSGPVHTIEASKQAGTLPDSLTNATEELQFRLIDQDYTDLEL